MGWYMNDDMWDWVLEYLQTMQTLGFLIAIHLSHNQGARGCSFMVHYNVLPPMSHFMAKERERRHQQCPDFFDLVCFIEQCGQCYLGQIISWNRKHYRSPQRCHKLPTRHTSHWRGSSVKLLFSHGPQGKPRTQLKTLWATSTRFLFPGLFYRLPRLMTPLYLCHVQEADSKTFDP